MNSNPRVYCILLNWNGWRDTIECLNALKNSNYPHLTIIVVDNGSIDDSVARIKAAHPEILLLQSGENLGYAGGNNIGIRYALAQGAGFVWLLNNDTLPDAGALSALVAKAWSDDSIGAVASICYYADAPERVQIWAGGRANLWTGYTPYSTVVREDRWFDWLNGTSLLISARALNDAGLLDAGFFLYCEDTEFTIRLRKRQWKLAAAPESRVLHRVSASTGRNLRLLDRYSTTSMLRLLRLHSSLPYAAMPLFLAARLSLRILRFQFTRIGSVFAGVRIFLADPR